ncbi:MAG: hypothetical protein M3290_00395 [Actinomycetota bacterium]|nr:hypothetical protein [Actinomycetota bacterium]
MGDAPAGTTFKASGADTMLGGWRVEGEGAADLCFRGLAGARGPTSVVATWTTPWNPIPKGRFTATYQLTTAQPGAGVTYTVAARVRFTDERWSPWFSDRFDASSLISLASGGSQGAAFVVPSGRKPRRAPEVQWEWKVTATATSNAVVDVSANLRSG